MVGLKKCGTNMIIRNFFFDLNKKWLEQYGFYNSLIDYHSNPNLIDKNKYFYDRIKYNFKDISKVAIVSSSVPIVLSHLLSQISDVTLISNHPAFIKTQDFYTENFNTTNIIANPFFDQLHIDDYDLIIFPEFEYFIPLYFLPYLNNKRLAILHHITHLNNGNDMNDVYNINDFLDKCDLSTVIEKDKIFNRSQNPFYYALGVK